MYGYMTRTGKRGIKSRLLLSFAAVVVAALIVLSVLGAGMSDARSSAYAAGFSIGGATPYTAAGKKLNFTINSSYSTTDTTTNTLAFDSAKNGDEMDSDGDGIYCAGDVYSSTPIYLSNYNGDNLIANPVMVSSTLYVDLPIASDSVLAEAIRDDLVNVYVQLFMKWGNHSEDDGGAEKCTGTYMYFTGNNKPVYNESGVVVGNEPETQSMDFNVEFAASDRLAGTTTLFSRMTLPSVYNASGTPFFRLSLHDFVQKADCFNISIREFGLYVEVAPKSDVTLETSKMEIFDSTGARSALAGSNEVKAGDVVVLTNVIQSGAETLAIDESLMSGTATSVHGRFYRRMFLRSSTDDIIRYDFHSNELTRVYSYTTPSGSVNLSSYHSGMKAAFRVESSTSTLLLITLRTWRSDGVDTGISTSDSLLLDNRAADQPFLTENVFFSKYIGPVGKAYFTDESAYIQDRDENNVEVVKQIDLGAKGLSVRPLFTNNSLAMRGGDGTNYFGSTQVIYYKSTVWTSGVMPTSNGERSEGFSVAEASGIYCTVTPGLTANSASADYSSLYLTMPTHVEGGITVYEKSALFTIEFMTMDLVGNYSFCPMKYFIKVDVTDYSFTYSKTLNVTSGDSSVSDSEVTISFTTLDDNGVPKKGTYTGPAPAFKRGDKVLVYVKFTSSSMKKYALTNFNTQGYNINTEYNVYESNQTSIKMSDSMPYTFEVNSNFTENESLRYLRFIFKLRASISITGLSQSYSGAAKGVTVVVSYNGAKVIGSVSTTYSTTVDGTYTSNLPVDVNRYYVRCELKGHRTYYAYATAIMEITPAVPRVNRIVVDAIDYGESLAEVDFDPSVRPNRFNTAIHSLNADGTYYSDRSYDGIYGYYKVDDSRLSTNGNSYIKPSAGYMSVPVVFVPIKVSVATDGTVTYLYDDDGNFITDGNYKTVDNLTAEVNVRYSTAVEISVDGADEEGVVRYEYDGREKSLTYTIKSTITGPDGRQTAETGLSLLNYTVVSYETAPQDGSTPVLLDKVPSDAGRYTVTVTLVEGSGCNYTGSFAYTMIVEKRSLSVEGYNGVTTFKYQQETPFAPIAYFGRGSGRIAYEGLRYAFTYYYYDGSADMAESAKESNLVPESEFFAGTGMPQNADRYVARVEIDETNFENDSDKFVRFDILQADATYDKLSLNTPTIAFNSAARNAHIDYQQKLSSVILSSNQNTGVKFEYHVFQRGRIAYENRKVEGRFIVTNRSFRSEGRTGETVEEFVTSTQSYSGYDVGSNVAYLYFIPEDSRNFLPIGRQTSIVVGRANYIMTDVTIDSIVYGKAVSSIEDLTVSENVKISLGGEDYRVLDKDSADFGYTYSLVGVDSSRVYPSGNNYIVVRVTPNDPVRFAPVTETLLLAVERQQVSLEYADESGDFVVKETVLPDGSVMRFREYTYRYGAAVRPNMRFSAVIEGQTKQFAEGEFSGGLSEISYYDEGREVWAPASTFDLTKLAPGSYRLLYTLSEDNFVGSLEYYLIVEKDVLNVGTLPSVYNVSAAVAYDAEMSAVQFYGGSMLADVTGETVSGRYAFRYAPGTRFTETGVRKNYYLNFTPDRSDLYEICESEDLKMMLTVTKADLSSALTLSVTNGEEGFVYGTLTADSDLVGLFQYHTPVYTDGTNYSDELVEGYRELDALITVGGLPTGGYLQVGTYSVTITIDDANYSGTKTVSDGLKVTVRPAKIVLYPDANGETNEKLFRNRNQSVSYAVFTLDDEGEYTRRVTGETVTQRFSLNGTALRSAPIDIGKYDAVLTLNSENYSAEPLETGFVIKVDPSQIRVTNLEQTYNIPRAVAVSLGLNDALFTVGFVGSDGTLYENLPTEAGEYEVHLYFSAESNNGYEEEIVYRENGEIRRLEIAKYVADIVVNELVTVYYTGTSYDLRPGTEPYGLNLITEYLAEGSEEWTTEEVLSANSSSYAYHYVRFTVDEPNYSGTTTIRYQIRKSALTVVTHPVFGAFVYNDHVQPTVLEDGRVDFAERIGLTGKYTVDVDAVSVLSVGKHKVTYTFTAYDGEEPDNNFLPVEGQADLTIVKRVISAEDFLLGEVTGNVAEYNGNGFSVDARVRDGAVYDIDGTNIDFRLVVYYDDNVNAPRDPGTYTVRVSVSSRNYSGEYVWDKDFIINKGKPQIETKPSVKSGATYTVGDVVTTADLEMGSGKAIIRGGGTTVSGDFSVVTAELTKANYNDVEVVFTPNDLERFDPVNFSVTFFAVGENPLPGIGSGESWSGKEIDVAGYGKVRVEATADGRVYYGSKLRAFTLRFVGDSAAVAYLNGFGLLDFADGEMIPGAGETEVAVVYTPYGQNADVYTIMNGTVPVTVEKATLTDVDVRVIVRSGDRLGDAELLLFSDGDLLPADGTVHYYADEEMTVPIDDEVISASGSLVYYRYESANYLDLVGAVVVKAVERLSDVNMEVGRKSKSFDGRALSTADLYIRIVNTAVTVAQDDIAIRVYKDGVADEGIEVGTYTVVITVENELVYGRVTTTFDVTKRDVSEDMTLDRYSSTYGSVTAPRPMVDGEYVNTSVNTVVIRYKRATDSDASYNSNLPVRAGTYSVRVSVEGEAYVGTKVFEYVVERLPVRLVSEASYVYRYGAAGMLSVSFRSQDGYDGVDLEYSVYYYSRTYSMTRTVPENAGTYTARIVMEESDYSIGGQTYAEVTYIIEPMATAITTPPTAVSLAGGNNLVFGQPLSELALIGGDATRNDVSVEGRFVVEDGEIVPDAGVYYATVRFLPTDKNYAESTVEIPIRVGQAPATVTFDKLVATYDGSSRRSAMQYTVSPAGVAVSVSFINSLGETLTNPVAAGTYSLVVVSNDKNYRVTATLDVEGNPAIFTIAKASVRQIVAPRANSLTVGESVEKSAVVGGEDYGLVYYEGFSNPIEGTFAFLESSYVFTSSGTYKVEYLFHPTDGNNFADGRGTTEIVVNKAVATVTVEGGNYTYAGGFRYPTFSTYPAGLKVEHNITFREYDPTDSNYVFDERDYVDVGTYEFFAWIVDDNYTSERTAFRIVINKRNIDMDFVDEEGAVVQQYNTTFGVIPNVRYVLYPMGTPNKSGYLLRDEEKNGVNIVDTYEIRFVANEKGLTYDDHRPPTEIGTYTVTVTLISGNYTAEKTILYKIGKGKITSVSFDKASVEDQVYGAVVEPIVLTEPTGVSYKILYHGTAGGLLPTEAGSYNITVQFNDPSYEPMQIAAKFRVNPKPLTVTNIYVADKTYDGTATLSITGDLYGVVPGDEISLTMTAETADDSPNVGTHRVRITSARLSGLQNGNYNLVAPSYDLPVTIYGNKVLSSGSDNFITSTTGFNDGTTVEFVVVNSASSASTFFENLTGRSTKVIGYTIKQNGADVLVEDAFKVYVEIPQEFLDSEFDVKGVGALNGKNVVFSREGNYITFYASSSGQVEFKKTEFSYTAIVILISIGIALLALVVLVIVTPIVRRRKISDDSVEKRLARLAKKGY
ncbi:MAG: hypothetical protein IJ735_06080 [Clostridia bacterium]|nr:hypothetical protein [Clostridia bacterium]